MRLTVFLLTAVFIHAQATTGVAQNVTLKGTSISLKAVFAAVEKQTGYFVLSPRTIVQSASPVSVSADKIPLEEFLSTVFASYPDLQYKIRGKSIFISRKSPVMIFELAAFPVNGRVTDSTGAPLPGATISIRGKSATAVTDENGQFKINAEAGDVIIVSFVGYVSGSIKVTERMSDVVLSLKRSTESLHEVAVVSTGYQQIPAERATGSFSFVGKQLYNRRVASDVLTRLEGLVPGMVFNRNVNPINNPNGVDINIRGHSTINSNDQPLIVVDNFPFDGNIQDINPNDVESVTILKDAAAASIWGARSGNGVIVFTMKKGTRNQRPVVELTANTTIGEKPDLFYNRNFLNATDFIDIERTLFDQGYYDGQIGDEGSIITPVVQLLADARNGKISQAAADAQIDALRKQDYRYDLKKYFYQPSLIQQYQLSVRGGGNNNDYSFSAGYDRNRSDQVGNANNRLTLNAGNRFDIFRDLTLSTDFSYLQTNIQSNAVGEVSPGGGKSLYPYARLVGDNGEALAIVKEYNYAWITDPVAQAGLLDWQYRPYEELRLADNTIKRSEIKLNTGLSYRFLNGFKIAALYQLEKAQTDRENYGSVDKYTTRSMINRFTNVNGTPRNPVPIGGIMQRSKSDLLSHRGRMQLDYRNKWQNVHEVAALAGVEISQLVTTSTELTAYGYNKATGSYQEVNNLEYYPNIPYGGGQISSGLWFGKTTDRYLSYFGNASYTYRDRYTGTASARIDKSNLFGVRTNQKANPQFSLGLSWELNKEAFYKLEWLPFLKLRGTFGYTGNINKFGTGVTTIYVGGTTPFTGDPSASIGSVGNPLLRWERFQHVNVALDFGLRDQCLTGSIEFYYKKGMDLFGDSPLAPSSGVANFYGNTSNTKGNGIDIALNSRNIVRRDFMWTSNFTLGYVVDKVTGYADTTIAQIYINSTGVGGYPSVMYPVVGRPLFSLFAYPWAGLSHDTGDPQGYLNGAVSTDWAGIIAGTYIKDLNYMGTARPTVVGSLRNTFTYRQLSLSLNIMYKLNYYFRAPGMASSGAAGWAGHQDFYHRWQKPGDEQNTHVPSLQYPPYNGQRDAFYLNSEVLIHKGDHIRLQDINLSYDLGTHLSRASTLRSLQLYAYVNNIGVLWKANKIGLDPDIYAGGLPYPRTYAIGIKASL